MIVLRPTPFYVSAPDGVLVHDGVVLRLNRARKRLGGTLVLDGLDLVVVREEKLVIIGPSGSGKSTLLRVLSGLERLDRGAYTGIGPPGAVLATQQLVTHDIDEALYLGETIVLLGPAGEPPKRWRLPGADFPFGQHPLREELLTSFAASAVDR